MRVLQVIPSFLPATRYGGPTLSVLRLCQGLIAAGVEVDVATTDADGPGRNLDVPHGAAVAVEGVPVRYFARFPRYEYGLSLPLVRFAAGSLRRYDLVHVTALFTFASTATPMFARRAGVPYVVSPRGMCMPWSLGRRSWKKLPYWHALERHNLRRARALHATSEPERAELERLFPRTPVFELPNPVAIEPPPPVPRVPGRVVFMGRLHPVKGFDVLIPAMRRLQERVPHAELVIAGPDSQGYRRAIEALIAAEPRPKVRFVGEVAGTDKAALLAGAEALALTSHVESFGNVVVEALCAGTPVVAGSNCPWRRLDGAGAGFWVDNTPEAVADALARVLTAPDGGAALRAGAKRLAAEYSIAAVGERMAAHYRALLARREEARC